MISGELKASLTALARAELKHRSREDVFQDLRDLRTRFRLMRRPDLEDTILDVMDLVSGWCGPHAKL